MINRIMTVSAAIAFSIGLLACGSDSGNSDSTDGDFTDRMAEEHAEDTPNGNEVAWMEPDVPVQSEGVVYASFEGDDVAGYLAKPADLEDGGVPGVIVIHEWWGLNENIEAMARRIAGEGYIALAVDLYDGKVAQTPDSARALMQKAMAESNRNRALDNLSKARLFLTEQGASSIGVIGWCFGGGWSLQTSMAFGDGVDATVIYYGQLESDPAFLKRVASPVLGIFGAEDESIPVESVREFESTLDSLGTDVTVKVYDGAGHAFANPSGERYQAEAAKDAWEMTEAFFARHLD